MTKIVCTIGPTSDSPENLTRLMQAGMNVARLNFSHGLQSDKKELIRRIRTLSRKLGLSVAILQDLAGPKIRTGVLESGPLHLESGNSLTLTGRKKARHPGEVTVSYPALSGDVKPGDPILLNDGALELVVESVDGPDIRCRVVVGGPLASRKGINLPGGSIRAPILTRKDLSDLDFGLTEDVDWIALSFVRSAEDILRVRRRMQRAGRSIPLIAKIEKHEAVTGIDSILEVADGLMVARGDLGVEIPIEQVPGVQKMLIEKANRAGKPVITATQMLKSMTDNPRPTRAEVTDVANAILDGSDAVMLSEETAMGRYPIESVLMMRRVATQTEKSFPYRLWTRKFGDDPDLGPQEAVARAACQIAESIGAAAIVTCTASGSTTRHVSKYRPPQPILALTPDETTYRRTALIWGAVPIHMAPARNADAMEREALRRIRRMGLVRSGDRVVLTAGLPLHVPGTTNLVKVATIP
ncbi:MAG: pyruvate kinase [Kiritimatiellia bacterium]|nr:pyruvate kinase [Kiritimatiellia bacterium]